MDSKRNLQSVCVSCDIKYENYVLCSIKCEKESLLLCIIFRSPNSTHDNTIKLCELLKYVSAMKKDQIITLGVLILVV